LWYKLTFYATDGTAEAQMFCFDTIAKQIIRKPCELLVRTMNVSGSTPTDLSAIIGLKFTFAVNININSYYARERIFNVNSIIQAYGKEPPPANFHKKIEDDEPLTSDELTFPLQTQDSPATAMRKLSTAARTSLVPTSLTYSPTKDDSIRSTWSFVAPNFYRMLNGDYQAFCMTIIGSCSRYIYACHLTLLFCFCIYL
jgi:replication factor A1